MSLIGVHELSEWICSRQLLLCLELVRLWLHSSRLLLIIVEALQHRKLVSVWYRGRVGSQRLTSLRKDIAQRIRFLAGVLGASRRRIGREYIEKIVCHVSVLCGRRGGNGVTLWPGPGRIRCKVKEIVSGLAVIGGV